MWLIDDFGLLTAYKKKIGFTGVLLIEPKPKEPTKHQYDYGTIDLYFTTSHKYEYT